MSKRAKLEEDQLDTVPTFKPNADSGLLETFNHALSSIISHRKTIAVLPKEVQEPELARKKKSKPLIWFPDEAVRGTSETTLKTHGKKTAKVICEVQLPIKEEDHFDEYQEWIDGNAKCRYSLSTREAQSHSSGWAMKYTNNHNKFVLKKTCVGVLLCSENCTLKDGNKVMIRPAISDKVRERQIDQLCPNSECRNGRIVHRKCTGNNGYPVTHFWIHHMDSIQFESKGSHDHPKPEAKRTTMRKKEAHTKYNYSVEENLFYAQDLYSNDEDLQSLVHCPRPTQATAFAGYLGFPSDCIKSCDVTDGNEHVCFGTARMHELAREILSDENYVMNFTKAYVLCRTLPNYIHGYDLLESRIMSCATPECPLVLVTLYRSGTVDGVLEHIKHLIVMCSSSDQKIRVPKWHFLVHDFQRDLQNLVVETIVNLMVDSQMQTLLNEFQYKSVSSLYKMLRQKMLGTLRTFEEHFTICKYEALLRIQDPITVTSSEELFSRLQSQYYTAKEFLKSDALIKDGVFGSYVREFWRFWGSDVIAPAVFPAAKIVYGPIMHHYPYYSTRDASCQGTVRIQDAFISVMDWLDKRGIIFPTSNVWIRPHQKQQSKESSGWISQHVPQQHSVTKSHGMPVILSYGSCYGEQLSPYVTVSGRVPTTSHDYR